MIRVHRITIISLLSLLQRLESTPQTATDILIRKKLRDASKVTGFQIHLRHVKGHNGIRTGCSHLLGTFRFKTKIQDGKHCVFCNDEVGNLFHLWMLCPKINDHRLPALKISDLNNETGFEYVKNIVVYAEKQGLYDVNPLTVT